MPFWKRLAQPPRPTASPALYLRDLSTNGGGASLACGSNGSHRPHRGLFLFGWWPRPDGVGNRFVVLHESGVMHFFEAAWAPGSELQPRRSLLGKWGSHDGK
jgi:hypothetical protein